MITCDVTDVVVVCEVLNLRWKNLFCTAIHQVSIMVFYTSGLKWCSNIRVELILVWFHTGVHQGVRTYGTYGVSIFKMES